MIPTISILCLVVLASGCTYETSSNTTQSGQDVNVANFTGSGSQSIGPFEIKGQSFKLIITAETQTTSDMGSMNLRISSSNYQGFQMRSFSGPTWSDEIEIDSGPGSYTINVETSNLKNWRIEVWDVQ